MHKTFLEFNDRAIAAGIQKGAPALAGHLRSTADRLNELAKNSAEESEGEEDENESVRSVQPVATESRSRRQGGRLGLEPVSILGYQATYGEEEEEEEEDAGEIAAPPAQFALANRLPLSDLAGTESMQQLRNEVPKSKTQRLDNNIRPVLSQQNWVGVLDKDMEPPLRSKQLYLDGHSSVPFSPIDPPLASDVTPLPAENSPYRSPSLNSSGGPPTPESIGVHWPDEAYSIRSDNFWNKTTNVSKASDTDMKEAFDD